MCPATCHHPLPIAAGVLILSTQCVTYATLGFELDDNDVRLVSTVNDLVTDCAVQAVGLTAFRLFRWYDAQPRDSGGSGRS